jgi:hypothetical protein
MSSEIGGHIANRLNSCLNTFNDRTDNDSGFPYGYLSALSKATVKTVREAIYQSC